MKRLEYIDMLKGISILSITLLHFEDGIFPMWLHNWISSFMVVSFYFTSGYVKGLSEKTIIIKDEVSKRIKNLWAPYLWFSLIILIFDILWMTCGFYDYKVIFTDIYKTLVFRGIGTLWFIPSLFAGEIIVLYLIRKNKQVLLLFLLFTVFIYVTFYQYWSEIYGHKNEIYRVIDAPFRTIFNICLSIVPMLIGYQIAKFFSRNSTISKLSPYSCFMIGLLFICSNLFFSGFGGFFKSGLLNDIFAFLIEPVLGPIGFMLVFMPLQHCLLSKFLSYWGKNSLVLMTTHYSILLVLFKELTKQIYAIEDFSGIVSIYCFVLTILLEYLIVWFINKKAKFLLGK
jgi:fucose 4-O-acetylase-like acetyltransferase